MLEQVFKQKCHAFLLQPYLSWLSNWTNPIQLTITACVMGIVAAIAIACRQPWLAATCLLLSGWFDMLDGALARYNKQSSPIGAAFDIFSDRIVEGAIVVGLFLSYPHDRGLMALLMLVSMLLCITSFLVVGIFSENQSHKSFHYSPGLMERAEAFIFFLFMFFMPQYFTILAITFSLLVFWTGFYRMFEFVRLFR